MAAKKTYIALLTHTNVQAKPLDDKSNAHVTYGQGDEVELDPSDDYTKYLVEGAQALRLKSEPAATPDVALLNSDVSGLPANPNPYADTQVTVTAN